LRREQGIGRHCTIHQHQFPLGKRVESKGWLRKSWLYIALSLEGPTQLVKSSLGKQGHDIPEDLGDESLAQGLRPLQRHASRVYYLFQAREEAGLYRKAKL